MKNSTLRLFIIIVISTLVGYYLGINKISYDWKNYKPQLSVESKEPPPSIKNVDFSMLWTVLEKLNESYYDKSLIDPKKLVNGAINGMLQTLGDPYTVYLPPPENKEFKQGLAGNFEGIGAQLGMKGTQIVVIAPLDGSPAEKAGVKAGDVILKVDGKATTGWNLNQAVEKIRGQKGTQVTITFLHKTPEKQEDLTITRDTINVKSVFGWIKQAKDIDAVKQTDQIKSNGDKHVMYVRLSQFGDNTNREWVQLINKLYLDLSKEQVKGVILDLRNNPGGYLNDATFIASEFIKDGVIVYQEKGNGEKAAFSVSRKGLLLDTPVIVLINKGSASASEIVAGALRDSKRGQLVGETSFGKGTIQQAEDLGNGAGVHITIAKWITPKGFWVHGKGLDPDVKVALDTKDPSHDAQLEKAVELLVK